MESNTVQQGKIFVGGISFETTEEKLTKHFCRYGEVVKSQIIRFTDTGYGKGFGFVIFADSSVLDQILQDQHIILGRTVDVKLAIPKGENRQRQRCSECQQFQRQNTETSRSHTRKIFVGGLPPYSSVEDFKKYFERFGRIEDAKVIHHKGTNTPRGFGFVTYDSEEAVTNLLQNRFHLFNNKFVEVKRAEPRENRVMDTFNDNFYPTNYSGYGLWPIYDSYGTYTPHYWANHTSGQPIPFNNFGTNVPVAQPVLVPVPIPYFAPRYPVNCYGSMHNQVDNEWCSGGVSSNSAQNSCHSDYWGSHNSVTHEGNDQDCKNIEVQLVGNASPRVKISAPPLPRSAKPPEKDADNGEKDRSMKNSQAHSVEDNGDKDQYVKNSQVNTKAENGEKDHIGYIPHVNTEHDSSEEINGVSRCI